MEEKTKSIRIDRRSCKTLITVHWSVNIEIKGGTPKDPKKNVNTLKR